MKKGKIIEVLAKVIVAALTAFLTAITTTSCMGYGPLPKIVQISLTKNPLAFTGGFFSHGPHGDSPPCDRKSRPSRVFRIPLDNF